MLALFRRLTILFLNDSYLEALNEMSAPENELRRRPATVLLEENIREIVFCLFCSTVQLKTYPWYAFCVHTIYIYIYTYLGKCRVIYFANAPIPVHPTCVRSNKTICCVAEELYCSDDVCGRCARVLRTGWDIIAEYGSDGVFITTRNCFEKYYILS